MGPTEHAVLPEVSAPRSRVAAAAVAVAGVLCVLLLGLGATQLRFNASYRAYFDADDPMLLAYDQLERRFDSRDALLLLVAARPNESVFSPAGLTLIRDLTAAAADLPGASHVDSLTNSPYIEADPDGFRIRELLPESQPASRGVDLAAAQLLRRLARGDRLIEGALVDRSGRVH